MQTFPNILVNVVRIGGGASHVVVQVTMNRDLGGSLCGDLLFQVCSDGLGQIM